MTNVPPKPDDDGVEVVALEISTVAGGVKSSWSDLSKAQELWAECQWLYYGYGKSGPWQVRVEWHKHDSTPAILTYTTNEEPAGPGLGQGTNLDLLIIKAKSDFTDGTMAPTPPGDLFTMKIWKDA